MPDPTSKVTARIFAEDLATLRSYALLRNEDFTALIRHILHAYCERIRAMGIEPAPCPNALTGGQDFK
jgi:hypothetical protein